MSSVRGQAPPRSPKESRGVKTVENPRVSVEEGYERWGPIYDCDPNPLLALEERQLKPMLPRLEGKRVLDLACGTGRWLAWLLAKGACLGMGVDISPAMLAATKGKGDVRTRVVQADCREIPFANAAFDLVLCSFAIGHLFDLECVVREVARVTTTTADVYVSDLHPIAYARGWRTGFRDKRGAAEIAARSRSAREILAVWESASFQCIRISECCLGEPERPIFNRTGKAHVFEQACLVPAVLICHFKRSAWHQDVTKLEGVR